MGTPGRQGTWQAKSTQIHRRRQLGKGLIPLAAAPVWRPRIPHYAIVTEVIREFQPEVCGKFSWRMGGWPVVSRRLPPAGSSGGSLRWIPATPSTKLPGKLVSHGHSRTTTRGRYDARWFPATGPSPVEWAGRRRPDCRRAFLPAELCKRPDRAVQATERHPEVRRQAVLHLQATIGYNFLGTHIERPDAAGPRV